MEKILAKLKSRDCFIFFSLTAICFISNFIRLRSFGVYGDDWGAGTYLFSNSVLGAVKAWIKWGGELANFRPLAIVLPVLWYWGYALFHIAGVYIVIGLIYSVMFFLGYKVLSQRVSVIAAYLATVVFILYPTNNFFVWQVAVTYALSLALVFAAVLLYWKQNFASAFFLLLCSALVNEGLLFIFLIALLPAKKITLAEMMQNFWQWLKLTGSLVILYVAARVTYELSGFVHGGRLVNSVHSFHLFSYIAQFFKAIFVELVLSWGFAGWKILNDFQFSQLGIAVVVVALVWGTIWVLSRKAEALRSAPFPYWYLLVFGLLLIFAGRYYGFYYVPSINVLNLDSRYYFASSVGSFVFAAGLIEMLAGAKYVKWRYFFFAFLGLLIVYLAVFKYEVQLDAVNSWSSAKIFSRQMLAQIPSLRPGETVIINMPPRVLGKIVETSQALPDLRLFFGQIYGQGALGFLSSSIQNQSNFPTKICLNSDPFYTNFCINKSNLYVFTWDGQTLVGRGNSLSLKNRAVSQNLPGNLSLEWLGN